ncbi:MAG TPA: hypothetical protein VGL65_03240 [Gemmatimonadales bacterium]|jgi:hypothetical protein
MATKRFIAFVPVLLLAACGGGGAPTTPAAGVEDTTSKPAAKAAAKQVVYQHPFDTLAAAGLRPMVRETYQYEGGGSHDPFMPIQVQVDRGPELADLKLVAILFDAQHPDGSIATFRDIGNNKRYTLVSGQRLGRLSVVSISDATVKLREDDFGTARDQSYSLRKTGDETP